MNDSCRYIDMNELVHLMIVCMNRSHLVMQDISVEDQQSIHHGI